MFTNKPKIYIYNDSVTFSLPSEKLSVVYVNFRECAYVNVKSKAKSGCLMRALYWANQPVQVSLDQLFCRYSNIHKTVTEL